MGVYHSGEIAVQERAGVREMSKRVGNGIHTDIPDAAADFLSEQSFVIVGATDLNGDVWASVLFGEPGFAAALDTRSVTIAALPDDDDPLHRILGEHHEREIPAALGMLAIEPATRRRMRVNGEAVVTDFGLKIHTEQVYANCPKYIQTRTFAPAPDTASESIETAIQTTALTAEENPMIRAADTFYIATTHPSGGSDASHRGGNPGFVRIEADGSLLFPDYSGNTMFNTLGNIAANGKAGLLFIDWEKGDLLHLTGDAKILWDDPRQSEFAGAERLVEITVRQVLLRKGAAPLRITGSVGYSKFNPVA